MGETMFSSLLDRFEAFKCSDEERQQFIKTLIEANEKLENELKTAKSDHLDQLNSRRFWQEKAQSYESKVNETTLETTNGFLLCLIDGDGYLFENNLISRGAAGGGEAANRLLYNIKRSIEHHDGASGWKVVVRLYANIEGLVKKFEYNGVGDEGKTVRQFVAGFNQSQPLFDFVDAGQGEESADHKIKEQLSLFVHNKQYKHIILGVPHDSGYNTTLDPYKNTPAVASRISLLKNEKLGQDFDGLPFEVLHFDSIFGSTKLPNERAPYKLQAKPAPQSKPAFQSKPALQSKPAYSPEPPALLPVLHKKRQTPPTCFTTRNPIYPGPVLLNKANERVDEDLGTPSDFAWKLLHSLTLNDTKICNIHYLLQRCNAGSKCRYSHQPTLEKEELIAFALKARLTPCHALSKCRDRMCVSGHVCSRGAICQKGDLCRFFKVHHVDARVDRELTYEDGEAPACV
ncbi:MAG: hypothetical protein Q9168_006195 [Polycauliona sp. 1 TL-2023]